MQKADSMRCSIPFYVNDSSIHSCLLFVRVLKKEIFIFSVTSVDLVRGNEILVFAILPP